MEIAEPQYVALFDAFLALTDENIDETALYIAESPIGLSDLGLLIVAQYFFKAFRVRPKMLDTLAKLFVATVSLEGHTHTAKLPTKVLDYAFGYDNISDHKIRIREFYFIRRLMKYGVFKTSDITARVESEIDFTENCIHYIFNCCCWAPEIDSVRPHFFDKIPYLHYRDQELVHHFFSIRNDLEKDNWSYFYQIIENEEIPGSIADILMHDDLESLIKISTNDHMFDYSMTLPANFFEHRTMLQRGTKLVQAAAFFGSIKCMKYLIMNGVNLNEKDMFSYYTAQYAVSGGSLEAVRLTEQNGGNFLGAAQLAIEYFQPEILQWIYTTFDKKIWAHDMYNRYRIHNAALVGNLSAFLDALETGDKINQIMDGASPLILAIKCNSFEIVMSILRRHQEDLTRVNYQNLTLIQMAINYSKDEMIEYLLDQLPEWDHYFAYIDEMNDFQMAVIFRRTSLLPLLMKRMKIAENPLKYPFLNSAINAGAFRPIKFMAEIGQDVFPLNLSNLPKNINVVPKLYSFLESLHLIPAEKSELPKFCQTGYIFIPTMQDLIDQDTSRMPNPFFLNDPGILDEGFKEEETDEGIDHNEIMKQFIAQLLHPGGDFEEEMEEEEEESDGR